MAVSGCWTWPPRREPYYGELARRDVRPVRVIGIDRSRSMLSGAVGLPRSWSRIQADTRALPFGDDNFDVVTVCYMLHLLAQEARMPALQEVHRVVQPCGRVVAVTVDAPARELRWLLSAVPPGLASAGSTWARSCKGVGLRLVRVRYAWSGCHPSDCSPTGSPEPPVVRSWQREIIG